MAVWTHNLKSSPIKVPPHPTKIITLSVHLFSLTDHGIKKKKIPAASKQSPPNDGKIYKNK